MSIDIGVLFEGYHTDSATTALTGGRLFPGVHERARINRAIAPDRVAEVIRNQNADVLLLQRTLPALGGRRLRQALTPTGHDKLIETVRGTGYRFRDAD